MDRKCVIRKTEAFVREHHDGEASGHDWWHIQRVRRLALRLREREGGDRFTIELAALLHDIADYKLNGNGDITAGAKAARSWLGSLGVPEEAIAHVSEIIGSMSWRGAKVRAPMRTIEGKIVQDADRLDGIGAIGVARVFAYGGYKGRPLHDPAVKPRLHESFEEYRASSGPTVTHFYERLLLHRDHMNTATAKRLARRRHEFLKRFLERFHEEWDGNA